MNHKTSITSTIVTLTYASISIITDNIQDYVSLFAGLIHALITEN